MDVDTNMDIDLIEAAERLQQLHNKNFKEPTTELEMEIDINMGIPVYIDKDNLSRLTVFKEKIFNLTYQNYKLQHNIPDKEFTIIENVKESELIETNGIILYSYEGSQFLVNSITPNINTIPRNPNNIYTLGFTNDVAYDIKLLYQSNQSEKTNPLNLNSELIQDLSKNGEITKGIIVVFEYSEGEYDLKDEYYIDETLNKPETIRKIPPILGFVYVIHDKNRNILCLYEMYISSDYDTIDLSSPFKKIKSLSDMTTVYTGSTTPPRKMSKHIYESPPPRGTVKYNLYKLVLESIINSCILFPIDATLWLNIDMNSQNFMQCLDMYIKFGFKNPYFGKRDPLMNDNSYIFLGLTKKNQIEFLSKNEINNEYNKVLYLIDQNIKKCRNETEDINNCNCTINFSFERNTLYLLSRLVYNTKTLNEDGTITQKEFSGSFKFTNIKNIDEDPLNPIYVSFLEFNKDTLSSTKRKISEQTEIAIKNITELSNKINKNINNITISPIPVTSSSGKSVKYVRYSSYFDNILSDVSKIENEIRNVQLSKHDYFLSGTETSVFVPEYIDSITFHTHPYETIKKIGSHFAFPSPNDIIGTLISYINSNIFAQVVVTQEGIYVISLTENFINAIKRIEVENITKNREFQKRIYHHYDYNIVDFPNPNEYCKILNENIYNDSVFVKEHNEGVEKEGPNIRNSPDFNIVGKIEPIPNCELIQDMQLLKLDFKTWEELTVNTSYFSIYYGLKKNASQCFIECNTKILQNLYNYKNNSIWHEF